MKIQEPMNPYRAHSEGPVLHSQEAPSLHTQVASPNNYDTQGNRRCPAFKMSTSLFLVSKSHWPADAAQGFTETALGPCI
jgi:hypothetical protein